MSQARLARQAGVDPMVIARLEGGQKPRLEVETAAKLAGVLGWTLDQFCGLADAPAIPPPPPPYTPLEDGMPAWLADITPSSTDYRKLGATILAWQVRGASVASIVTSLTTWGIPPFLTRGRWNPERVRAIPGHWTYGTRHGERALLLEYGFTTEAGQHGAWWRRQHGRGRDEAWFCSRCPGTAGAVGAGALPPGWLVGVVVVVILGGGIALPRLGQHLGQGITEVERFREHEADRLHGGVKRALCSGIGLQGGAVLVQGGHGPSGLLPPPLKGLFQGHRRLLLVPQNPLRRPVGHQRPGG